MQPRVFTGPASPNGIGEASAVRARVKAATGVELRWEIKRIGIEPD